MLKRLSERAEFWVVLLLAYAYPVVAGLLNLWNNRVVTPGETPAPVQVSDADLWTVVVYEMVMGALILGFLRARGRPWSAFRLEIEPLDLVRGLAVFFGAFGAVWLAFVFASALPAAGERLADVPVQATFGLPSAVFVAVINPLFEECVNLGYIQTRLRAHGASFAVGAALLVRLLANLDQGPHVLVGIVPLGLLFGIYHWRTGRLGPVIVAHAMIEAFSLFAVSHQPASE